MNTKAKAALAAAAGCLLTVSAYADPVPLSAAQMDSVVAAGVERVDGFVCPVITTDNVLNSPKGGVLGDSGHYTIGGPDVAVPIHATNGDGTGVPPGPHSAPGDTDYTAIWAR